MDGSRSAPLLRRNGMRVSCEPCRKLKYRCDHAMPICGRCYRRQIPNQCRYDVSPARTAPAPAPAQPSTLSGTGYNNQDHGRAAAPAHSSESPGSTLREAMGIRIVSPEDPGFLGSTSYSAILTENGDKSDLACVTHDSIGSTSSASGIAPSMTTATTATSTTTNTDAGGFISDQIGPRRMDQAVAVLKLLHHFPTYSRILARWHEFEMYTSMIEYFVSDCLQSVKSNLIDTGILNSERGLARTAERLFQDTCKKIPIPKSCTMAEMSRYFSGTSLRWESLAVFFTACGQLCCLLLPSDPIFDDPTKDKKFYLAQLYDGSSACVTFCEEIGPLTDLGLWVHYEHLFLSSQFLGYTHYLVWNHLGATANHIIAQGLHIDGGTTDDVPLWLVEMRRRYVAATYVVDKLFCRFCGRPPRLSQRYCSIHVPLDIGVADLAAGDSSLQAAVSSIGVDGWNVKGRQQKSYLRCLVMCSMITEEALELSLGVVHDDLQLRVEQTIDRNQALLNSLPKYLRYGSGAESSNDPLAEFMAAQEHLGILLNDFMLHRCLCRRLGRSNAKLLQVSHQILSIVLDISNVRCPIPTTARYAPWFTIFFGLPPAAVLVVELLQRKRQQDTSPAGVAWPQVVQDLSVLVSNLKWMYLPGDGNYQLGQNARRSLQFILDAVLAEPYTSSGELDGAMFRPMDDLDQPVQSIDTLLALDNNGFDANFWTALPDSLFPDRF